MGPAACAGTLPSSMAVIDLHCHILPGVDDGPADMGATVELARAQVTAGVRRVVATPHVTWELPANEAPRIREAVASVNAVLEVEGIDVEVVPGGEIGLTRAAAFEDEELQALTMGDGPWVLVEPPLQVASTGFDVVLHRLGARGHRVVLAHPERSPGFQRDPGKLEECVAAGMLTSITAGSLVGRFGTTVQRFTHELVRAGLVHNVASDAHDVSRRPPGLRDDIEAAGMAARADWWTRDVPAAILAGEAISPAPELDLPAPPQRRRLRPLWRR